MVGEVRWMADGRWREMWGGWRMVYSGRGEAYGVWRMVDGGGERGEAGIAA